MSEIFPRAPITEALIDIRVQIPEQVSPPCLELLHKQIQNEYPNKKARRGWAQKFEFKVPEGSMVADSKDLGVDGYLFSSADEKQVVQYRLDGFTFSRLRPYLQWNQILEEAKRLWVIYAEAVKPILLTRLALRYINSIEIPSRNFDLEEYFTSPPTIPSGLPQLLEHFFSQLLIQFPDQGAKALVTQTISPTKDPMITPVLFDIDVFVETQLKPNDQKVLRTIKNAIFDRSLKEKTKELFR
jgi:uncharacterized protein (TIGR04255 family)